MIKKLNRAAIGLYPMAFRERYGDELEDLIEQQPASARSTIDLAFGAARAHISPQAGLTNQLEPSVRVRLGLSAVLTCWIAFAAAGFGFAKTTERDGAGTSAALSDLHGLIQILAVVGMLAILVGGLPLAVMALRHAFLRKDRMAKVLIAPLVAGVLFTLATATLVVIANTNHSGDVTTGGAIALITWGIAATATAAVCVVASRKALFKLPANGSLLKRALWFATIATGGMILITLATAVYSVGLSTSAPELADALDGPLQANSASISIDIQALIMLVCASLATLSTRRAWRAAN